MNRQHNRNFGNFHVYIQGLKAWWFFFCWLEALNSITTYPVESSTQYVYPTTIAHTNIPNYIKFISVPCIFVFT